MTHRTFASWNRCVLTGAVSMVAVGFVSAANARPTIMIKECAQASTLRSTIDPKKKDAAQKQREVERLMAICRQKAAEPDPGPPKSTKQFSKGVVRHDPQPAPRPVQTPPPRPQAAPPAPRPQAAPPAPRPRPAPAPPPPQGQQRTVSVFDLLNRLRGRQQAAPAPQPQPPRPMAPAPAAPPAAAPPAAPPAAAPVAPAAFTPPAPPPAPPPPVVSTSDQRNVFGLQLGETLTLPACAPGVVNANDQRGFESTAKGKPRPVAASCVQTGAPARALAQKLADAEGKPVPSDLDFALVRLASDRCPDWVSGSCTLSVALKAKVMVGVSLLTIENGERDVVRALGSKYNGRPTSVEPVACDVPASGATAASRRMGNDATWKFADLNVSYWPVNGLNCGQGRILVQSTTLTRALDEAMSSDAQPKM